MLIPTSNVLVQELADKKSKLYNEPEYNSKNNKKQTIDSINTVKIDFTKMSKIKSNANPYTQCKCGGIVTIEDQKQDIQKDGEFIMWACRFCHEVNRTTEIYYCPNNYKATLQKNIQRGFLPPILIFLIDNSGSMGESVTVEMGSSNQEQANLVTASKEILQIIQNSIFSQKNSQKQAQFKDKYDYKFQKDEFKKTKMKGSNYYSKITLFMAFIENHLNKLKANSNNNTLFNQFRIGFIFFNEFIHILKPVKQKQIPVIVPIDSKNEWKYPFQKQKVDFNDYNALFNVGQKNERFFGDSKLRNIDFSKLMVQYLNIEGTTALGPALAVALGIASVHDIGSRIVIVSDSLANVGILSPQTKLLNESIYKQIHKTIQSRQITIGVLNWITQQVKSVQQRSKNQFVQFLNSDKERIKTLCLDFSLRQGHVQILNTAKRSLQNLMNRGSLGSALSIKILCSNPKIQINKFKYDQMDFRVVKFLGRQCKNWIQLKPKKIKEQDLLFPIMTQIIIIYEDVFSKQKYLFMSYVKQKLIGATSQKEVYEYLDVSNKNNLQELIDLQKLFTFDRQKIIPQYMSSRTIKFDNIDMDLLNKNKLSSYSVQLCDSLNQLAELENKRDQDIDSQYL